VTTRWERLGLRTNLLRDDGERAEKVSFIELFFDLVFVFAITQVSHTFVASIDAGHVVDGFLQAAVVLLAVWWVWVYTAWVTNWLDPDKRAVRWMLIVLMVLWLVFSTSIPEAFDGRALFTISSMIRFEPVNAINVTRLTIWFGMSAIFWFSGALNSDAWARLALWSVAIGESVLVTGAAFTQSRRARGLTLHPAPRESEHRCRQQLHLPARRAGGRDRRRRRRG